MLLTIVIYCFVLVSLSTAARLSVTMTSMRANTALPILNKFLSSNCRVILGSGSPRRKELLQLMGITDFEVLKSSFEEDLDIKSFKDAQSYCLATASAKLADVVQLVGKVEKDTLLIGADTIVEIDGNVLEKPVDDEHAKIMLTQLGGRTQKVHTAVVIYGSIAKVDSKLELEKLGEFVETSEVKFVDLTEADINAYVATGEGRDKSGAYGIQGIGGQLVQSVNGCYFNVMGLPISSLSRKLAEILQDK